MDDRNLTGKELKVVEYSIVSVKPELKDDQRLLSGSKPHLTAFTDEMSGEDFVTWIVASFLQTKVGRDLSIEHKDKKYLRVCWRVMCRFLIEDTDYLREISDTLKKNVIHLGSADGDDSGGSSGSSSGGPAGAARRGGKKG